MQSLMQVLEQNLETKESDYKKELETCEVCGDLIEKLVTLEGFNRTIKTKVNCKCKREALEAKRVLEENKEKQIRLNSIIKNSLMDNSFRAKTFENWDYEKGNEKMHKIGVKYSNNFKEMKEKSIGLLIYGEPGNGKTFVSAAIANKLLDDMVPVICISINSLLSRIKETFNSWGKEAEDTIIKSLSNADLLIIDDLGTEQATEWSKTKIYNIIDSRYRNGLPLIISTNVALAELENKYDKRTYDRLLEMCTPIKNDGLSIRRKKAVEKTEILKNILSGD